MSDYATKAIEAVESHGDRIADDTKMSKALVYALLDVAAAIRERGAT
ncbi:MAG TPA: hypothetical protein VF519_06420 [Mycobacteriales bacterium]|jgi:hypothetical protein